MNTAALPSEGGTHCIYPRFVAHRAVLHLINLIIGNRHNVLISGFGLGWFIDRVYCYYSTDTKSPSLSSLPVPV